MRHRRIGRGVRRILDMVSLAVALAFAFPIAVFGLELLLGGRTLGAFYVALAAAIVVVRGFFAGPETIASRAKDAALDAWRR